MLASFLKSARRAVQKTSGSWKRISALCILSIAPFCTTGCFDRQELEQQAFVSVLGIDKAPGNLIDCTFRISVPVNPSGAGSKDTPLAGKAPITIRAHTVTEAMVLAQSSVERTITFSHLTLILFSSTLARDGLLQHLQPLLRYREFRRTIPIGVTKNKASEVIDAFKPMLDTSTARVADSVSLIGNRTGLIPTCRLQDYVTAAENPHQDIVAPMYGVNQFAKSQDGQLPEDGSLSFQAGNVRRSGGNPVDWMGAAVFHGDRVVDYIDGEDSIYLRLLEGSVHHAKLDLQDPSNLKTDVTLDLHKEHATRYNVELGSPTHIHIHLPIDVDVVNVGSGQDYSSAKEEEKLEQSLNTQLNAKIGGLLHRLVVEDQSDVVPLSRYIRGKFSTFQEYSAYPWTEKMKEAQIDVNTDVHVRRLGVQMQGIQEKS